LYSVTIELQDAFSLYPQMFQGVIDFIKYLINHLFDEQCIIPIISFFYTEFLHNSLDVREMTVVSLLPCLYQWVNSAFIS